MVEKQLFLGAMGLIFGNDKKDWKLMIFIKMLILNNLKINLLK